MAAPDDTDDDEPTNPRHLQMQRFIELGGGTPIEFDLARLPKIADVITQQHKDLVKDLAMSGLPHDAIAKIMCISKERLQTLFDYELTCGFEIAHASLARALYIKGLAGDTYANTSWLRLHNKGQWADKRENTDKGAEQEKAAQVEAAEAAAGKGNEMLALMITAMSKDSSLYKPPPKVTNSAPTAVIQSKPKPVKAGTTMKKPKGD